MTKYTSRRSPVYSTHGSVASSQPLASEIGLSVLKGGGNAADAAVAVAAALNVTEPCSTGIGGDCFCLYFDAKTKEIHGLNSSGRCPSELSLDRVRADGITGKALPTDSAHCVTVPGAAAGWAKTLEKFGTLDLAEVLEPAIRLAEEGFPVHPIAASTWKLCEHQLRRGPHGSDLMVDGRAPRAGEIMRNPYLAQTFRELGENGLPAFYEGRIAKAMVDIVASKGGTLSLDDLKEHSVTMDQPISVNYKGFDVFEIPPNGQGITALIALNILKNFDVKELDHNSADYLHVVIEAMRLAFADTRYYVADPKIVHVPVEGLLSEEYGRERSKLVDLGKATVDATYGSPQHSSDTVYFCVVDGEGNACSFINSNYEGFGSGLVPSSCGFSLQNRGANFSLEDGHPNVLAPRKRPYHTIIPGMLLKDGEFVCAFGVMGGFMQPQGHVQVLLNSVEFALDPQAALDLPRFCIQDGTSGGHVCIEDGISDEVLEELRRRGHDCRRIVGESRYIFGRGQMIFRSQDGVLCAGSDPRGDGAAMGW